jgi:hypothetical protein
MKRSRVAPLSFSQATILSACISAVDRKWVPAQRVTCILDRIAPAKCQRCGASTSARVGVDALDENEAQMLHFERCALHFTARLRILVKVILCD